jgi:hypothetical protein
MSAEEAARSDFLAGEVHALLAFALAVARAHPNPAALLAQFLAAEQAGLARLETQLALDELVEGYQFVTDRLRVVLEAVAGVGEDHHSP